MATTVVRHVVITNRDAYRRWRRVQVDEGPTYQRLVVSISGVEGALSWAPIMDFTRTLRAGVIGQDKAALVQSPGPSGRLQVGFSYHVFDRVLPRGYTPNLMSGPEAHCADFNQGVALL